MIFGGPCRKPIRIPRKFLLRQLKIEGNRVELTLNNNIEPV